MKCPDEVNVQRQNVGQQWPRDGGKGEGSDRKAGRVSVSCDENVLKLTVMTAANVLKYILKNY